MDLSPVTTLEQLHAFSAVETASHAHDFVGLPADPVQELVPLLDGKPHAGGLTRLHLASSGGVPVGTLTITLPLLDNLSTATLNGQIHPDHRRRGLGRQLLAAGIAAVRDEGRTRVFVEAHAPVTSGDGPAGPLLRSTGARPVLDEHRRLLDLSVHPPGPMPTAPAGYRLVQWQDRCPDELVDGAAYLMGRMTTDAPMGEMDYEPERWDAERYREKEGDALLRGRRRVATAVLCEGDGSVAGITDIGVNRSRTEVAYQWDTIVDPDHRGHGLGRALKQANHSLLVDAVTGVRWVNTWNAASNAHMVRVNDALGFRPMERWLEWQLDL